MSLVLVSDYEPGTKTWHDERRALAAFLRDPSGIPDQVLVMENGCVDGADETVPGDIQALAPRVQVVFEPTSRSAELKDAAVRHCRHDIVAVVEADCLPDSGWLRALVTALEEEPALDAVSSPTRYGSATSLLRVATLLDRGGLERRLRGPGTPISNNGAVYRKRVLETHPYPRASNPFVSADLRHQRMRADGVVAAVIPTTSMLHAYGGIRFLIDVRRNKGFQAAQMLMLRQAEWSGRPARHTTRVAVRAVAQRARRDLRTIRDVGPTRLRRRDWPLMVLFFLAARIPEFLGALAADDPEVFSQRTAYR